MGQISTKFQIVSPENLNNPSFRQYNSLQSAIDSADNNSTILLDTTNYTGEIRLRSGLKFTGINLPHWSGKFIESANDIIFENIIFENSNNDPIVFENMHGLVFRNCEFQIKLSKDNCSRDFTSKKDVDFGIKLINTSAVFENCVFIATVNGVGTFILLDISKKSSYVILQSPIIRVNYTNSYRFETFVVRGPKCGKSSSFECFSASMIYRSLHKDECCDKSCRQKHCQCSNLPNKCSSSHVCCSDKCRSNESVNIRLFRGFDQVYASLTATTVRLIHGRGYINLAASDEYVYVNTLTVSAAKRDNWWVGDYKNLFLSSFISNLRKADDVPNYNVIESKNDESMLSGIRCDQPSVMCSSINGSMD